MKRAIGLILLAALGLAGCADRPSAREQALTEATDLANKVARISVQSPSAWTVDQLGRRAAGIGPVVKAEGTTAATEPGVTLTMRFATDGIDPGSGFLDSGGGREEYAFCFEIRFAPNQSRAPREVPCPQADPITFPPAPPPPALPTPEQLDQILRSAGTDEKTIRAALDALNLDPRVRVEVEVRESGAATVIAARAVDDETRKLSCVMARRRDGEIKTWSPAAVQLQPGELTCSAGEALAGYGITPPH